MDERQGVVQHLVGNVDHDCDVLIKEAYKLRTFLRQKIEMAQGQGGSIIFPNLHELHSKFLEDTSVFVAARKVEKNSIEFLFLDAQCMSKVVGVGLHQALVTVTNDNDVRVEALSESAWICSLASMFKEVQDLGAFELIGFRMRKMEEDNNKTMSLPSAEQVAKQFGVGLKDFQGDHIVTMNKEESNMFFPVILKVAEVYKALKVGDPHVTKRPSGVGSSTGAARASSSGSSQQGKEEGKSVRNRSLWKPWTWWEYGKGDEKDDEGKPPSGDPPPDSEPSSEPEKDLLKYTVQVYAKEKTFRDARQIPDEIKTASINPYLEIVFFRHKTGDKFLDVTTTTQCNLGPHAHLPHFGWFQDDIKISFGGTPTKREGEGTPTEHEGEGIPTEREGTPTERKGTPSKVKGTALKNPKVTTENDEEGIPIKEATHKILRAAKNVATQTGTNDQYSVKVGPFGVQPEVLKNKTETFEGDSSTINIEETTGVKQIEGFNICPMHYNENLIYLFCIPTSIKESNNPSRFKRYRNTFIPKIVGHWEVFEDIEEGVADYTFKVERHLFHIEQGAVTFGRGCLQDYVLEMFINLAMTHLDESRPNQIIKIREENYDGPAILLFPVQ
jgi:hypothetical protein